MLKRETPFILCEAICEAVRQRLPDVTASDSTFFFDYEGPSPLTTIDPATVQTIVERLLRYSLRTFGRDGVFFRVTVNQSAASECRVSVRVATVVRKTAPDDAPTIGGTLSTTADIDLQLVEVLCRSLDGSLVMQTDEAGAVVEAVFLVSVLAPCGDFSHVTADGAAAWLVGTPVFAMKMLGRRLQRLGWQIRLFESALEVQAAVANGAGNPPALIIGSAHRGVTYADMQRLRPHLPPETRTVLQALQRSTFEVGESEAVEVHAVPLSPRRLIHYTELARQSAHRPTGHTQHGDLDPPGERHVLVVDDNPVNRTLAEEMLRMLGYRAESAARGEEALVRCREHPPALVLMDLNMPGLGGLETTRQIRALQAAGEMAKFSIVAVSAQDDLLDVAGLPSSGFDSTLSKPIEIATVRETVQRWAAKG